MKTNPDDLAFPCEERFANGQHRHHFGLTKREYFAAMAMQGMIANEGVNLLNLDGCASDALQYADALIARLRL